MLALTRRIGEILRIEDDVRVVIIGIKGNQVRIGIDAPKQKSVHREEVYQRIQREKANAKEKANANAKDGDTDTLQVVA